MGSVHMSSTPTADLLDCPTVLHLSTNLAARRLCPVSWLIGLLESGVPPLRRLQQQVAHLGYPLTVLLFLVIEDKEAVLVSHPATTPGDARWMTSALLREESAQLLGEECPPD